MRLNALGLRASDGRDPDITGLAIDSRAVRDDFLFAALPGSAKKATFWQYSASPIDQNWFNGSRSRLKTFALRG